MQRAVEGPIPAGDALLRWICWSSGAGVLLGLVAGLLRHQRLVWAAYGAAAPWLTAALMLGALRATKPVREMVADRHEAACRANGRAICTVREFRTHCERGDAASLGAPRAKTCGASTCTSRWLYTGPFRPDNYVAPGSLLCSMVVDTQGKLARAAILPGDDLE